MLSSLDLSLILNFLLVVRLETEFDLFPVDLDFDLDFLSVKMPS